jgi:hypothetical protein
MRIRRSLAHALTSAAAVAAICPIAAARIAPEARTGPCTQLRLEFFGGLPLVQARVNGSPAAWFLLDTASSFTFVDARTANALGLRTAGGMTIRGGSGSAADIVFAEDVAFEVGDVKMRSRVAVMELRMKYDRPLAGILGAPFFQRFVTHLDFSASTLHVCDPGSASPLPDGPCIPFRVEEEIPLVDVGLKLQGRDEIIAPVFVDTGASQALGLNRPFVASHRLAEGQTLEDRRAGSLTGPVTYRAVQGATVRIGTRLHADVEVGFWPSERTNRAGVIGNRILRDYVVVLDYGNRCMYLKDPAPRR